MADGKLLFTDIFSVVRLNPEGRKFDRVSRLVCKGETYDTDLSVDIATQAFPCAAGDKITVSLASTLRLDGKPDEGTYDPSGEPSLLDSYEYGMAGKVFQVDHKSDRRVNIFMSFGGLLLLLQGDYMNLSTMETDQRVYCLIRHAGR